ncbi:ATP-binding protein [Roseibium aggregatum]|uniref:histidine kinase n=1 Tax=Roseibium aggregatum TaxID=187304 RepID=A0A939EHJ6_9HYPH|nr:ATP-binding protein [Roseibium aggregatum]MBN9673322.1 PAS-domain containing protein [Roseibium aggregatum]
MIDPNDPLDIQVAKQSKIIEALIDRVERSHKVDGTAYSLFQSAIALQAEVWEKTRDLEEALNTLGRASGELEIAYKTQEQVQKNLADVMVAMEGGFALFSDEKLQVFNALFKQLLPDVEPLIQPGLAFDDFLEAVSASRFVIRQGPGEGMWQSPPDRSGGRRFSSFVIALRGDRWYQLSYRQTSSDNIAVLLTEVTEIVRENRREKKRLIEDQAQFLQAAFDHLSLGICTFSSEGELLVRNERFGELLGIPLPLLKEGIGLQRIVEYVERNEILERRGQRSPYPGWFKAVLRGKTVQERVRRRDGVRLDLRTHSLPDNCFLVTVMDVTAETKVAEMLEQRVQERTAELTEANRMLQIRSAEQFKTEDALRQAKEAAEAAHVSKTRFLAAASHDLLQPINAAKLYISTLGEIVDPGQARETVERLGRSFESIESLLHALLDISRLDSAGVEFNVTCFSLDEPLRALEEDLAPLAAKKNLELKVIPSSCWVMSDRRYLMRCIGNLAVNAIQYTESGRVLVGCRLKGNKLSVEVWDTGIGISEEDQARIFDEFTRVNDTNSGSGMGLGLSIIERACRHLGHEIRLSSEPGRGSMFAIELPLANSPEGSRLRRKQAATEKTPQHGPLDLIVMVVENDEDVLHATTQRLDGWGASVLACGSTACALELMAEIGTPPDIILADYQLDGDDTGDRAIRALRAASGSKIPGIVITAKSSKALLRLGHEESFSVLKKPVNLPRLRALIDWKTRREAV